MSEDDPSYTLLAKYNLLVGNTVALNPSTGDVISSTPISSDAQDYGIQSQSARGLYLEDWSNVGSLTEVTVVGAIPFADIDESRKMYESCTGYGCYYGYWHDMTNNKLLESYGTSYPADVYDSNSKLYGYVENYESYLKGQGYNSASARLMTYKEAEDLGCVGNDNICTAAPTWVYSNSYWLGSANGNYNVWFVLSNGGFGDNGFDNDDNIGVRPVITILKSEVQS